MSDEIKAKIAKVLELAKRGGTEEEANSAMSKALEMLAKYNLSMSDVEQTEVKDEDVTEHREEVTNRQTWQQQVWAALSKLYFCQPYVTHYELNGKRYTSVVIVGKPSNCAMVRDMSRYIVTLGEELASGAGQDVVYRNSWKLGFSSRISERCSSERRALSFTVRDGDKENSERALAIINLYQLTTQQNKDYLTAQGIRLRRGGRSSAPNSSAGYSAGRSAGDSVSLKSSATKRLS